MQNIVTATHSNRHRPWDDFIVPLEGSSHNSAAVPHQLGPVPSVLKEPFFDGLGDGAGAAVDVQFGVDVAEMRVHRVVAQLQFVGDFFFDEALRHQFQNFLLALRQPVGGVLMFWLGHFRTNQYCKDKGRRQDTCKEIFSWTKGTLFYLVLRRRSY